jgi:hypothetical protein
MILFYFELFGKAFEVWLLQLHEPEYFIKNKIICFQLFSRVGMICNMKGCLWEQKNDFKRDMLLHPVD